MKVSEMLVNYSSSESSDEDAMPTAPAKRMKLPSAADLLNCTEKTAPEDDPQLHGGRIRTFAHERGNWASYCYFKLEENHLVLDLRQAIQECCQEVGLPVKLEPIEELHLSLTKTVILRHHWIESFKKGIEEHLAELRTKIAYQVNFNSIKIFENEDKTRTFIALGVSDEDYPFLNSLVGKLDACLRDFNLPPFYEAPDYHVSFLWCLGSHGAALKDILAKLNNILEIIISPGSTPAESFQIGCDLLRCKIGNKLFNYPLSPD